MKNLALYSITLIVLICMPLSKYFAQAATVTRCEYQARSGEDAIYIGYDFNFQTNNFQNLVSLYTGQLVKKAANLYTLVEATGTGSVQFENSDATITYLDRKDPASFVLKCNPLKEETSTTEDQNLEILSEDSVDGEIKPNIEYMNYCGNDNAIFRLDLSKFIDKTSPWYGSKLSLYAERSQFGPTFDCLPGERRRENFKELNQLLNEARSNNNRLQGSIRIRKEKFAPSGYAVRVEIKSKMLGRTFVFRDNLTAEYEQ